MEWTQSAGSNKALELLNSRSIDFGSTTGAAALIGKTNGNLIQSIYVDSKPEWTALFSDALPRQLSGGMAQRVAIAHALVTKPMTLLLDEPFTALDVFTRATLQDHLLDIWNDDRPTLILVTHDIEEALVLSDHVILLRPNPGQIHREFTLDLPRPRRRTDAHLQRWKERLVDELNLSLIERSLTEV
ncbi:ATP-binding cassette domain-containing protein [Oscillatoria sp. FACHB-1407]|uniref:ATP-binding cassette domain-containing protein n=1 Tax=Oscillatoria sp. FACHB-1407 TaxID=2692847 RepID=UPI0018EFDB6A|nr:ATP-binding cassette domain-containing protein [Oscillatoria sp. FACHB-1407]